MFRIVAFILVMMIGAGLYKCWSLWRVMNGWRLKLSYLILIFTACLCCMVGVTAARNYKEMDRYAKAFGIIAGASGFFGIGGVLMLTGRKKDG